ncbi:transglutaminase-like cysteine peptidase [Desulfoplanes sp.]
MPYENGNGSRLRAVRERVAFIAITLAWIFVASTVHGNVHARDLFGFKDLRGNLSILGRWKDIMLIGKKEFTFFSTCTPGSPDCPAASIRWKKLEKHIVHESRLKQAKDVNAFFNQWPYILDEDVYGKRDHWASPLEFITRSGDCEDYAITKYFALKQMGFDPATMRIVVLKDTIRNITHAILTLTIAKTNYVLDNMTDLLLEDRVYKHYRPQYSFNETGLWLHIHPHSTPTR